ncbi:MAG: Radical SAM domain-containing protein [Bacillota bacterium]|nr:MAG: Radical SAM domain-containing protein [Bacillota bacterium]
MFTLVYADKNGLVYDDPQYGAVSRTGSLLIEPTAEEFIPMPKGSSLVVLPGRAPVALDDQGNIVLYPRSGAQTVAALLPQGYLRTLLPAYKRVQEVLPLFGYASVAWREGQFWVAASAVADTADLYRWDPALFNTYNLESLVEERKNEFAGNRVLAQLAHCSLEYGCFTAQNIIYRRFEAGLPLSPVCNANCVGCISLQPSECCPSPQNRIDFLPTVEEVATLAVKHLTGGGDMVSFGQGCEGEPLVQGELAAEIIGTVRSSTKQGRINANTNAGNFAGVKAVVDAGIDSLRVSLNTPRQEGYNTYYRQQGYSFADVVRSVKYAREQGVFVSINLLVLPGVSDREEEVEALLKFIEETNVNQVQFRNLNIDPDVYLNLMPKAQGEILGMLTLVEAVRKAGVLVR